MAKLTREDILKLAQLSRLELTEDEITGFTTEISAILDHVEQLQDVELKGVVPTYQVTGLEDVMRDDVVVDYGTSPEDLLKNAPNQEDGQFKVRRMVG